MLKESISSHSYENLSRPKYRADIDGLRAIAVLSVVGFHAFPDWVRGGFIGVDIFFVISGFLIATIIFGNLERNNSFDFFWFYSRRIKRIFPALLLVLIATFAFGWFVLFADEYQQLGKHIAGGAGFVSNFVLWNESGYFDASAEAKPLLHLWSLGIEEQFYIVWPLILFLAWKRRLNLLAVTIAIGAVSFALNIGKYRSDVVADFYSPQTRFWELMLGSILAYAVLYKQNVFANFRRKFDALLNPIIYAQAIPHAASISGAALIAISVLVITKDKQFPGWLALMPTLGAALLISAGMQAWLNRSVLSSRVLVWIGLISFPLYLWHWPLLSFAQIIEGKKPSLEIRLAAILVSIALASLTYTLIEKPIRFGNFAKTKTAALVVLMILTGFLGYKCFKQDVIVSGMTNYELDKLLNQVSWPGAYKTSKICKEKYPHSSYCVISNENDPSIALIGDSQANQFFPGLSAEYSKTKENLVQLGGAACPPLVGIISRYAGQEDSCQSLNDYVLKKVAEQPSIHTVILAANWHLYLLGTRFSSSRNAQPPTELRIADRPDVQDNMIAFKMQMQETISLFRKSGKKIIVIKQIPELNFSPLSCFASRSLFTKIKPDCRLPIEEVEKYLSEYEITFDELLKNMDGVTIWDPKKTFCDNNYCYAAIGSDLLYRDDLHLSLFGSSVFARNFAIH